MEILSRLKPYELTGPDQITIYNQPDCILPKSFFEGRFPPKVHPESLDWDQWWDEQIYRCLNGWSDGGFSVTPAYYFHLNMKKINMLDKYDKPMFGNPYFAYEDQQLFDEVAQAKNDGQGLMLVTGRGFGKCLAKDTKVLMYSGELKNVQDVVTGDLLMGPDSMPRTVLSICSGIDKMYKVVQRKGMSYTVNSKHILALRRNPGRRIADKWKPYPQYGETCNIEVEDFIVKSKKFKETFSGYRHQGIEYPAKEVHIPPYWLGIWLGDGNNHNTGITSLDSEIVEQIYGYAFKLNMKVTVNQDKNKSCPTYTISAGNNGGNNPLITLLRNYNLIHNKHIPEQYLINSKEVRLQILAGLIDSDGYYKRGNYSFTLKDKQLADDIVTLAHSLGFNATWHEKVKHIRKRNFSAIYHYVNIYGNVDSVPCKLERKKATVNKNKDPYITSIKEIIPQGEGEYYGFTLDKDHLFILEDGTVAHNSFAASSLAEHTLVMYEASETIISASTDKFASNLHNKVLIGLNSLHDELRPSFLTNDMRKGYIETGVKGSGPDKGKVFGYRSKLWKAVYDDDPGLTRGTRPDMHVFEEVGSWTGAAKLIKCYKMTEASWWRGKKFTCFPLLIGTGGQMEGGGSEDAKKMFWDPTSYNLRVFSWDGQDCCKFVPAYKKFGGYYENSGVSDEEGAKAFLDKRRQDKKKSSEMYRQETMEFPFDPFEAFMVSGSNWFNINLLEERFSDIERTPELQLVQTGDLKLIKNNGKVTDVKFLPDPEGVFEIVEHPPWRNADHTSSEKGSRPIGLYVAGCDSFDAVLEEEVSNKLSQGCCMVKKRFWNASKTGNMYVGKIKQRTKSGTEFYNNVVKLLLYFSHDSSYCKMLYEYTKIGIGQHFITNKLDYLLYPRPKFDSVDIIKKSTSVNRYGVSMPEQIKKHAITKLSEYFDNYLDNVYFVSQLKDAIGFRFGDNRFDETMASAICELADLDMYDIEIREHKATTGKSFPRYTRDRYGRLVFK